MWQIFESQPFRVAGWVLVIGILLQVSLAVWRHLRRLHIQESRGRLELALLRSRLEEAALRNRRLEERVVRSWSGVRKFRVAEKRREAPGVWSFYLVSHDNNPLPPFQAGQFLTILFHIPGRDRPETRCYSLSGDPEQTDRYRITVKRLPPAPARPGGAGGLVSNYLCDQVEPDDILDVKSVSGGFTLDPDCRRPVVLIAGGIGMTPLLPKLLTLCNAPEPREVWFFHGVRNGAEHMLKDELVAAAKNHDNVRLRFCYSQPLPEEREGIDYHHAGRLDMDYLQATLPASNYVFHLCGPPAMMEVLVPGLEKWGAPVGDIHFEAFGPSSLNRTPAIGTEKVARRVRFSRSGKEAIWTPGDGSLLELAEKHGAPLEAGCRAGNCGSCTVALKSGTVENLHEPGAPPDPGSCLACIATPTSDLEVEA